MLDLMEPWEKWAVALVVLVLVVVLPVMVFTLAYRQQYDDFRLQINGVTYECTREHNPMSSGDLIAIECRT